MLKNGGKEQVQRGTTYDWAYAYATGENAVRPHAPLQIGTRDETTGNIAGRSYTYDANGNQQGWTSDSNGTRRNIVWDDENRIMEVQDPKNTEKYYYDDQGQRQVRRAKYGETAYVNQFFVVRNGAISSTHFYAGNTRIATKLNAGTPVGEDTVVIWPTNNPDAQPQAGTLDTQTLQGSTSLTTLSTDTTDRTRTTGNQGNAFAYGPTDRTGPQGLPHTGENPGQGRDHRSEQGTLHAQDTVKNPTLTGQLPGNRGNGNGPGQGNGNGNGADNGNNGGNGNGQGPGRNTGNGHNPDHTPGTGNGGGIGSGSGGNGGGNGTGTGSTGTTTGAGQEFLYYYHPDHLGSSSYVTDKNAKRYEHIEYFPFGETWVEESSNTWRTPYLFTSKEMDPQTKLYYFGARYYDPRTSNWISADPLFAVYLNGQKNGGIYNNTNLNLHSYAYNNPLVLVDPDGRAPIDPKYWYKEMRGFQLPVTEEPLCKTIWCNSKVYDLMDTGLATGQTQGAIQSDWFSAASLVTRIVGGFGAVQFGLTPLSAGAEEYMRTVHHKLAKENYKTFNSLITGKGLPGKEQLRGKDLEYALVDKEQSLVTKFTDEYFKGDNTGKKAAMAEISEMFDPDNILFGTLSDPVKHVIQDRFSSKGINFDFSNESHRKELGYGLVDYVREIRDR